MKIVYLDLNMGAAGDMLTAALLELLPDRAGFVEKLNRLQIPGVEFVSEPSVKAGITGTHMKVLVHGAEEEDVIGHDHEHHHEHDHEHMHEHDHEHMHEHEHDHEHYHDHEHGHEHEHHHEHHHDHDHGHHHHAGMHDIEHIVSHLDVPEQVKTDILGVYGLIAEAESVAHGKPVSEIHFHEVGTMDAVADVAAVCLLMHELAPEKVLATPVRVGYGTVHCAHGILPVPAPATAYILKGIPAYGGDIKGEMCTPTGAALLKYFVNEFTAMPVMKTEAIGYGMGKRDFPAANCVRAILGETEKCAGDTVLQLSCNVDDMTAEEIGFAMDRLFEGGAREVFTVSVGMKKSRPGTMICVICDPENKEKMLKLLFQNTTTIGVRDQLIHRSVLERRVETVETPYGQIRCKISEGYGVKRKKYEYDDLAKIAAEQGISIMSLKEILEQEL